MNIPDRNEADAPWNQSEGFCPNCEKDHVYNYLTEGLTDEQEEAEINEILNAQSLCYDCTEEERQEIKYESMRDD